MASSELRFGVIGLSEGNGHPYSWSAICNGYEPEFMETCPFPGIPAYLSEQNWPEDKLSGVRVTHVWTQDRNQSERIAKASRILNVVEKMEDMIGHIDAVLLARDDAGNHLEMARPFLAAGLPIFIDKPFALSRTDAEAMLALRKFESQIFTCSSLRFSAELHLSSEELKSLGKLLWVEASVPKYWDTYSIHLLEPIITQVTDRGKFLAVKSVNKHGVAHRLIEWQNLTANLRILGDRPGAIEFVYVGSDSSLKKKFKDSFSCFKTSIDQFKHQILNEELLIPMSETLELVDIIEAGR